MKHILLLVCLLANLSASAQDRWLRIQFKDASSICYATAKTPYISRYEYDTSNIDSICVDSVDVYYSYARVRLSLSDMSRWALVTEQQMMTQARNVCVIVRDDRIDIIAANPSAGVALVDLDGIQIANTRTDGNGCATIPTDIPTGAYELRVGNKSIKFVR